MSLRTIKGLIPHMHVYLNENNDRLKLYYQLRHTFFDNNFYIDGFYLNKQQ